MVQKLGLGHAVLEHDQYLMCKNKTHVVCVGYLLPPIRFYFLERTEGSDPFMDQPEQISIKVA